MRISLSVEFDGSQYFGWQYQHEVPSIQGHLNEALAKIADHPLSCHGAGRTDRGVHATCHVIHIETQAQRDMHAWVLGTNTHLPRDIRVRWAKQVDDEFHARFSATARRYQYVIYNHPLPTALYHNYATWVREPLDEALMQSAAQVLIGEHDFSSFRAASCQAKHPNRHIHHLQVIRRGRLIIIDIQANGFLHHMVRNIAGCLINIGSGNAPAGWLKEVLLARDRVLAGVTALPSGLYFTGVSYAADASMSDDYYQPVIFLE